LTWPPKPIFMKVVYLDMLGKARTPNRIVSFRLFFHSDLWENGMPRIWWVLAFLIAWPTGSQALCSGQSAEQRIVLEDDFSNSSGNWDQADGVTIGGGRMELKLGAQSTVTTVLNRKMAASSGADFCARFTLPESDPNGWSLASLVFWARDKDNAYFADVYANGSISFGRLVGGTWSELLSIDDPAVAVKAADGITELRVVAAGGHVRIWLNGAPVRTVDVPSPGGNLRFGVYVETDNADPPKLFQFRYFDVLEVLDSIHG
jgi:hypothetical protein